MIRKPHTSCEGNAIRVLVVVLSAVASLLLAVSSVHANSMLGLHDCDVTPDEGVGNWAAQGSGATVGENTEEANHWLEITFAAGDPGPGGSWYETISTPATDLFSGTWETGHWIEFDFWSETVEPNTLQVQWHGTANDEIWAFTLEPSGIGGWDHLSAPLRDWEDWATNPYVDENDYLADLNSIDWIGVYIFRDGTDEEVYGLDDFSLHVPEPEEYLMLVAALATAFFALRRRRRESPPAMGA